MPPSPQNKPDRSLSISSGVVMGFMCRSLFQGVALVSFLISTVPCYTQLQAGSISGVVTDVTGAVIATASIHAVGIDGTPRNTTAGSDGKYALKGLAPGQYQLQVEAPGFETYLTELELSAGLAVRHDAQLLVAVLKQEVSVASAAPLDLEPTNNASAITLQGSKLEALSDDPDDFAEDIQALSGPAAGPDGGEIFIDGFSGGKLPPKSAIREIRVNQNPFSSEYDKLGFGRVEIFTKPGSDKFRGEALFNYGNAIFNSQNPFATSKPDYARRMTEATISGPLGKKASFFFEFERRDIGDTSVINATVLDPSFRIVPYRQSVMSPTVHPELSFRLDYQLSKNHTLVGRYELEDRSQENAGLDAFSLPTRAYQLDGREQFVQLTETAMLSPTALNEVRFQYRRDTSDSSASSFDPATLVPQAFSDGGANVGLSGFVKNRWELTNVFSLSRGPHTIKLGGRIRATILDDESTQNFNGLFRFDSIDAYQITELGLTNALTGQQIRALGGGASQFSLAQGDPFVDVNQIDAGLFVQDDWRVAPKLTLSGGLRYELQNNISDWHDFAPRVGFAWAPGRNGEPFVVVRGGFGLFYQRVSETLTLNAKRLNGTRQRQYLITNPDFYPNIPSPDLLAANAAPQAIRVMQSSLRAPRLMQTGL